MTGPEGLLLVDKPSGPTSHDVVALVKRRLRASKVGHAGTLDPMASGLLPLALGRATRLLRFLPSAPKVYAGTLRLGLVTTTDDVTGEAVDRHEGAPPSAERVVDESARFVGRAPQTPPAYSARRVEGERMYRLARRGTPVRGAAVDVEVFRFDVEPTGDPWVFRFVASVSTGTYVRSLARDLGAALGCGGTLESLRRTSIGPFRVEDALPVGGDATIDPSRVTPMDSLPLGLPDLVLEGSVAELVAAGTPVPWAGPDGVVRLLGPAGLLGVGELAGGILAPRVVVC